MDLVDHLRSGCKPRSAWKVGTEHEKLGFDEATKRRLSVSQIQAILHALVQRFGWSPIMEKDEIIGCTLDGQVGENGNERERDEREGEM